MTSHENWSADDLIMIDSSSSAFCVDFKDKRHFGKINFKIFSGSLCSWVSWIRRLGQVKMCGIATGTKNWQIAIPSITSKGHTTNFSGGSNLNSIYLKDQHTWYWWKSPPWLAVYGRYGHLRYYYHCHLYAILFEIPIIQCFNYPDYFRIVLTAPPHLLQEACKRIKEMCDEIVEECSSLWSLSSVSSVSQTARADCV